MPSRYCTGNTARRHYRQKKSAVEMFYLACSDGWSQRLNAAGLVAFDQECAKRDITYTIIDPETVHVRDEVMLTPVYEG